MVLNITHEHHDDYEQVVGFSDDDFQCYIAVHNTKLGPAFGGCRIIPYASKDDALLDVLRLSKGMTYKNSIAGLNYGGGKAVVIADKPTREMMLKVGEAVNYFNGTYITAEDVGTRLIDVQTVAEVSKYVVHDDGSCYTAIGVLACMKAALNYVGADMTMYLFGFKAWVRSAMIWLNDFIIQL